jgi:hypothetical protein
MKDNANMAMVFLAPDVAVTAFVSRFCGVWRGGGGMDSSTNLSLLRRTLSHGLH